MKIFLSLINRPIRSLCKQYSRMKKKTIYLNTSIIDIVYNNI